MPLFINTNVASLTAQRNLTRTSLVLGQTFQRLSSGLRVNTAKDDAAGIAIGSRLSAQVRGLNQAVRNSNDAVSLAQVSEGALDETLSALLRIRELAVQSANDTNFSTDRANLDAEVTVLINEVDRISSQTKFNGTSLLNNTTSLSFHTGAFKDETITISMSKAAMADLAGTATVNVDVTSRTLSEATIAYMDTAIANVNTIRANLGSKQNQFQSVINNLMNVSENLAAARSRIMDADIAAETATLTRTSILQQAGTAVLAQANQQPQLALQLLG